MKKHNRILSLLLALVMMLSMLVQASGLEIFIIASSDEYKSYTTAAKYLETIGVIKGYDDGQLHLEEPIERYQAALFFARVITGITNETAWGVGPSAKFTDVPQYGEVMDTIADMDIVRGYGDGLFGYHDGIKYQDMCAMLVRALGYETDEMIKSYPMSYVLKVESLGFALKGVNPADYLNRGQTAQMVYDSLVTEINDTTDAKATALAKVLAASRGIELTPDETKETYLERNFAVSSQMQFQLVATDKYAMFGSSTLCDEGELKMLSYEYNEDGSINGATEWIFPVEGGPTNGVSEADLIGKYFTLVFDDKNPSPEKVADEKCKVIFAEMCKADVFENLGELNYVKYDDEKSTLTLNKTTVNIVNSNVPNIRIGTGEKADMYVTISFEELAERMDADTYFRIEAYDRDADGTYDELLYVPYDFGQYVVRSYKDASTNAAASYTLIGKYTEEDVFDTTSSTVKDDSTKTHFVEYLLGVDKLAAKSTTNYTPGDTTITVSAKNGELSKSVAVSGQTINSGEFMIYSYDKLTNKLYVAANLGKLLAGELSGDKGAKTQAVVIDGDTMSVGLPGAMSADGIFAGDGAYTDIRPTVTNIIRNYEKGEQNVRYLEYDGKIAYLEANNASDVTVSGDYVIVDIEETLDAHEDKLATGETAWDIGYSDDCAVVKVFNTETALFDEIKVEKLISFVNGEETTTKFNSVEQRNLAGTWADMYGYNLFENAGVLYSAQDDDKDGLYELYAYATSGYDIIGAPIKQVADTETNEKPEVFFSYNKSNVFVGENDLGISDSRITTSSTTLSIVIGADGYRVVKGEMGTNGTETPNELYLSSGAVALAATDKTLVIFDPAGTVEIDTDSNVYNNNEASIWHNGSATESYDYYLFGAASSYVETRGLYDADGNIKKDSDGNKLYEHEYKALINLKTMSTENVTIVSDDYEPPVTEVASSVSEVIRVDAENQELTLTTFGDVFVENGDYHYGGFNWLAAKDKVKFATMAKDENGDGVITGDEAAQNILYNSDVDIEYQALEALNYTFIDLDAGADVDYHDYSFADSYVFYTDTDAVRNEFIVVDLEDREVGTDYPAGTLPIKRHVHNGTDVTDVITNGTVSNRTAGAYGIIGSQYFFRTNGWSDYLIPAVDETGATIWKYEGSLRVRVTYYAYIDYNSEADTLDAVIVRIGEIMGVVGEGASVPSVNAPDDDEYNFTEE